MFVGYYICDRCKQKIDDVLTVRRWLVNGQWSKEETPLITEEYLSKTELCLSCANGLRKTVKKYFEDYGKILSEIEWFYIKDKLPELEKGEDEEPLEEQRDLVVAYKENQKVGILNINDVLEDFGEEGEHLIYAWAELPETPEFTPEAVEPPEEPENNNPPEGPNDPENNGDNQDVNPDENNNGPDGPDQKNP